MTISQGEPTIAGYPNIAHLVPQLPCTQLLKSSYTAIAVENSVNVRMAGNLTKSKKRKNLSIKPHQFLHFHGQWMKAQLFILAFFIKRFHSKVISFLRRKYYKDQRKIMFQLKKLKKRKNLEMKYVWIFTSP